LHLNKKPMKKTSILLIFSFFASFFFMSAANITEEQAIMVAQNFLNTKNISKDNPLSQISIKEVVKKEDIVVFYILNLGKSSGFIIVSASEYAPPIIGYSFENEFQWLPPIQFYLNQYSEYILSEEKSKNALDEDILKLWSYFSQEPFVQKSVKMEEIPPLITTHWNQNKFYNTYCPWDVRAGIGNDYRTYNGCVALATAQLMNYYRHPKTGRLGFSYKPNNYPQQTVFFSQHNYHWDAMCNDPTIYTNEIAKLAYHVGVAVKMNYGVSGSGAYTEDATRALHEYFFYNEAVQWSGYDPLRMKNQLDLLQPILMSGDNGQSGHAFLVDGYSNVGSEEEMLFHFNWGWGGSMDDYFTLRNHYFTQNTTVFLDIIPATNYPVQCEYLKRQTAFEGYVTNGSTNQPYQSNPDCSWIIAAPGAKNYTFSFSRLDTKENVDMVTIYNGSSKSSEVAASFSGRSLPQQPVNINADSVLITFTSNDPTVENTEHLGFLINYVADKPQQNCNVINNLSASSGYITDGTQTGKNYTPWVSCTWNVNPNEGVGFFGLFHEFDLRLGDFLDLYDATKSPPHLWRRFDLYTPPTVGEVFAIPFPKIQIKFITDNFEEGNGFKFQYFTLLGVDDKSLINNLSIFPNPANEVINLAFSSELTNQSIICRLVDVMGKEVYAENIDYYDDVYATQIPVAHLAKGFYFLQLVTKNGISTSKIIIN